MYGGHGGLGYARVSFNDIYSFDIETEEWAHIQPENTTAQFPEPRGGHSMFADGNTVFIYGGWNSEMQYSNVIMYNIETNEWSDPDIYNEIPRWNHSGILVNAIPSKKYFIFGGEQGDFPEGGPRHFGVATNSSCYLDLETKNWSKVETEAEEEGGKPFIPPAAEYAGVSYHHKTQQLLVYGGWNNQWLGGLYSLSVAKIVGPDYAVVSIEPNLGQLSGNQPITIKGQGFDQSSVVKVYFTVGSTPVDVPSKNSVEVSGNSISDDEIQCLTPNFDQFGPKEATVQVSINNKDLTTTYSFFSFFMNTRALKSLAYGPGLLQSGACGAETEFVIQARNDTGENRSSGRDEFEVKITTIPREEGEAKKELPAEIIDNDNGKYTVKYTAEEPCDVKIQILFKDDKSNMVPLRGSPYTATFDDKANANANMLTGPAMKDFVASELDKIQNFIQDSTKGSTTKDKDIEDVKVLIAVKDIVDNVNATNDQTILRLDALDESLKMLKEAEIAKESQMRAITKLHETYNVLKKQVKDIRKEIAPLVQGEDERNTTLIRKLEDELKDFFTQIKKRDFYKYNTGVELAKEKLVSINDEIAVLEQKIEDYGYNSKKFGSPDAINPSIKQVEVIKTEVVNMNGLWNHIEICTNKFEGYMKSKWIETDPYDMEDECKKLMKSLKEMKVDKKQNAYVGILEEIKKWLIFLPLIADLRDDSMRDRHW
jgi:dynein heavy chain